MRGVCSMKFYCEITSFGEESLLFLDDPNANFIILFNEDPAVGDTLIIGDKAFTITAIGDEALHTLRELGHCTFSFKGGETPERPGCIMLKGDAPLVKEDIKMGATIEIH